MESKALFVAAFTGMDYATTVWNGDAIASAVALNRD